MTRALQDNSYHCFSETEAKAIVKLLEQAGCLSATSREQADNETIIRSAYLSAAQVFEVYASDQIGSKRFQSTAKAKRECDIRAEVWNDAASELRKAVEKPS
ncbi:MAG: hypothetical protein ACOY5F_14360 [Pseudomonadota bacterium]